MVSAEVVIVGGGLQGLAIAWALTQRGVRDVLVLERATVGSGGTAKSSGVVRCHYGVPSLAAMAWYGTQVFERAADVLGAGIGLEQIGYVVGVGPADAAALRANLATQAGLGIEVKLLGAGDVAGLWPGVELDDFAAFGYEPRGGYADAYLTASAFAAAARRGGAEIRQGAAVSAVSAVSAVDGGGTGVRGVVLAGGERVAAGTVVVAAGPWSPGLLAPLGTDLPLVAHHEPVLLVEPGRPLGGVPVLSDLVSLQYVRPERSGQLLVGNSDLARLHPVDPDGYPDRAGEEHLGAAADRFAARFPGLPEAALATSYAGVYDCTPDFNPVLSATGVDRLFVAAGFSGHGYKISPAVGHLVADLVTVGHSTLPGVPDGDFRLSRFAEGRPLTSAHPYATAGQLR